MVAWGSNSNGQISGVVGLSGVTAIAAGDWHSLALKSDGTVVSWGDTGNGNTVPASLSGVSAIAGGGRFSLAIVPNP
jgi:alpha-tubulin suppressor-like RCC1 family protein